MKIKTKQCHSCGSELKSYYIFQSNNIPEIKYREYSCVNCQILITEIIGKKIAKKYEHLYPHQFAQL